MNKIIKPTLTIISLKFFFFHNKTVVILTLLTFIHYPNFSIITDHYINNDHHNGLCHVAWSLTWYLPSHLVLATFR